MKEEQLFEDAEVDGIVLTDYVMDKLKGLPCTKDWAEINLNLIGATSVNLRKLFHFKKIRDIWEDEDTEFDLYEPDMDDNLFDKDNEITYDDIDDFINQLAVTDYIQSVYEPDEIDFEDFLSQEQEDEYEEIPDEMSEEAMKREIDEAVGSAELMEVMSRQSRLKLKMAMKRNKAKIASKRKLALKRKSTPEVLKKRARKLAIKMLKKKFLKKDAADLSVAERERAEKIIKSKSALIDRLTRKLIPVVKKIEAKRFQHKPTVKQESSEMIEAVTNERIYTWSEKGNSLILKDGRKEVAKIMQSGDGSFIAYRSGVGRPSRTLKGAMEIAIDMATSTMFGDMKYKVKNPEYYQTALKKYGVKS